MHLEYHLHYYAFTFIILRSLCTFICILNIALRSFIAMKINNCDILCAIFINILWISHDIWPYSICNLSILNILSARGLPYIDLKTWTGPITQFIVWICYGKCPPLVQNSCSGTNFTCSNRSWNTRNWTKTDAVNQIHIPIIDDHCVCCFRVWYCSCQSLTSIIHKLQAIVPLRLSCFFNLSFRLVGLGGPSGLLSTFWPLILTKHPQTSMWRAWILPFSWRQSWIFYVAVPTHCWLTKKETSFMKDKLNI